MPKEFAFKGRKVEEKPKEESKPPEKPVVKPEEKKPEGIPFSTWKYPKMDTYYEKKAKGEPTGGLDVKS